jgi:uncharacterized protein (DUF433 family)
MRGGDGRLGLHLEADPYKPGAGSARVRGTGVPVWAIVDHMRVTGDDEERTAQEFEIPVDAVRAAVAYYEDHRQVIDARIAANVA